MSVIQAPIATIVDLFEQRDRRIAALEAEKAAYADRLTELEDRLVNMLQQRVALLEEKMGLEERLAEIEKAAAEKEKAKAARIAEIEKAAAEKEKAKAAMIAEIEKAAAEREKAKAARIAEKNAKKAAIAARYRLPKDKIDITTCVGRILEGNADRRWKPFVYREQQCGGKIAEHGLCEACLTRQKRYETTPGYDRWYGIVTKEPNAHAHMLGTYWAALRKPVFIG